MPRILARSSTAPCIVVPILTACRGTTHARSLFHHCPSRRRLSFKTAASLPNTAVTQRLEHPLGGKVGWTCNRLPLRL